MCDVIERIESHGIDFEQIQNVLRKRHDRHAGRLSNLSITLIVLGEVENEWRRRTEAEND